MIHEKKKVAKIIEELTMYFFALGADQIRSDVALEENHATITFRANYHPDYEEKLGGMEEYLSCQKDEGFEDIYWNLAGSGDMSESNQLLLVGLMTDQAQVRIEDGFVNLTLYKELLE